MVNKILNYWYQLEFFTPCWPVEICTDINIAKKELPWIHPCTNPKIQVSYNVYIGKVKSGDLVDYLLKQINNSTEEQIERDLTPTCICALKVDKNGKYIENSFSLSSFLWAVSTLANNRDNSELSVFAFEKHEIELSEQINKLQENIDALKLKDLNEILSLVYKKLNLDYEIINKISDETWAHKIEQYPNKYNEFPPIDASTELTQSFYLKDIAKIINNPTDTIKKYVLSMEDENNNKIEIDNDVFYMQRWLNAERFPKGVWPSKYSPCLMQQLGINLAISNEQSIFSVNGPPGTGKTTLLKEIIASNIVERAIVMLDYSNPNDAFTKTQLDNPEDKFPYYYKIDKKLASYGILVASNNNAAVENISIELPKEIKECKSELFLNNNSNLCDNTYFSNVACELLGEPAWGLISVRLGKKKNIDDFIDKIWLTNSTSSLKNYLQTGAVLDWNTAKHNFKEALQKVEDERKKILYEQNLLIKEKKTRGDLTFTEESLYKQGIKYKNAVDKLEELQNTLKKIEIEYTTQQENENLLWKRIPFFKKIFRKLFRNDKLITAWNSTKILINELVLQLNKIREQYFAQKEVLLLEENKLKNIEIKKKSIYKQLNDIEEQIRITREKYKSNWADEYFWDNISKNEISQTASPWTYEAYDKLREELFYHALILHKSFILSCKCVSFNIAKLTYLWNGTFTNKDKNASYSHLLNTFMLVVPVISTTFASTQIFLDGINAEELGLLIIDEAGQATPQSALGAIWRAKKSIIVGDPLQVEPIINTPKQLTEYFANKYGLSHKYKRLNLSVQECADNINKYGGFRQVEDEKIWIGCPLVLHRRCIEPMFGISNEIAYNGKMFMATSLPKIDEKFLLDKSSWFDCKGNEIGNKNHTVKNQIEFTSKLVLKAVDKCKNFPDLFIITPFLSVNTSLKLALKEVLENSPYLNNNLIDEWLNNHCGTIHTFQGKEAKEVLLVLGCDFASGKKAAKWVGIKPNIINVAVTRAKYRLGIIGDYSLWKNIPYVQTICKSRDLVYVDTTQIKL